jgi:hypothetical protein
MEKRVACYCRVSTDLQQGGMESQIRVLKTYCEQNKIMNAEFYTDEGISGTQSSRPALDRMMIAVEAGNFDGYCLFVLALRQVDNASPQRSSGLQEKRSSVREPDRENRHEYRRRHRDFLDPGFNLPTGT